MIQLQHLAVGQGGGEEEGEDEDHDDIVIDSVTDLVGALAKVMKVNFVPYFEGLFSKRKKKVNTSTQF